MRLKAYFGSRATDTSYVAEFQFRYNNWENRGYIPGSDQEMLKTLAALALFALAIVLVTGTREYSSKSQDCQAKQDTEKAGKEHPEGLPRFIVRRIISPRCTARFIRRENPAITPIETVLLAIITAFLAYIACIQYNDSGAAARLCSFCVRRCSQYLRLAVVQALASGLRIPGKHQPISLTRI
jgi:hypothetical protein